MNVKNIIYNNNRRYFVVDFNQNQVTYDNITVPVSKEIITNYLMSFFNIMVTWKEGYLNNSVIDGSDWKITVNFLDNSNKIYTGHGSYPDNFEAIERLISQIISEVF